MGGAILRGLRARGYEHVITRTHAELDLTDQAQTRAFFAQEPPEVVILAAARVGGILANWEYPYEFVAENLAIELNVIDEAFRAGVKRLIFLGSSCIYPKLAPQPLKEEYLLTGPLEETNRAYAIAKIAGIELCRSLNREYGTDYLSLMPTNLYGPGDNFDLETSHLLPALIRKFHEAKVGPRRGEPAGTGCAGGATPPVVTLGHRHAAPRAALRGRPGRRRLPAARDGQTGRDVPDGLLNVGTGEDTTIAELAGHRSPRSSATTARSTGTPASPTAPRRSSSTSAASGTSAGSRRHGSARRHPADVRVVPRRTGASTGRRGGRQVSKTALISGVTGQDGAYLAEFLLDKGYTVHGIKRRASLFNTDRVDHLYQDPHQPGRAASSCTTAT